MRELPQFVVSSLTVLAMLACTSSEVATPSAPNPTLTTPQPTAQLVATVAPQVVDEPVVAQSAEINVPAPTDTPILEPTATPNPTNTPEPTATPVPTNTPQPTPTNTPEPTPSPTPPPVLGSRENPVPLGQVVEVLKGGEPHWAIIVSDTEPNANQQVMAANQFNDPPEPGNQFFMAYIEAKYLGPDSTSFSSSFQPKTVGQSAVVFTTYENSCGVITDELPGFSELFTGGAIKGWECWQIPSADADTLALLLDDAFGRGGTRVWFDLK